MTEAASLAASDSRSLPWGRSARLFLATVYTLVFLRLGVTVGLPVDRWRLLAWLLAAMAISCVGRPWRFAARLLLDWLPFVLLLVAYAYGGGLAFRLGHKIEAQPLVDAERGLWRGALPSVTLQHWLLPRGQDTPVRWWEAVITVVYVSHFVVPYVLAAWLWVRDRSAWLVYVARFTVVSILALAVYALVPTTPPWMAAVWGLTPPLDSAIGRGWAYLPFHTAEAWLDAGKSWANPVAAFPSMHAALSLLVVVTLWPIVRPATRALLALYPLAMAFVLVYGGEHWTLDILAAWLCVAIAVVAVEGGRRWWRRIAHGDETPASEMADAGPR